MKIQNINLFQSNPEKKAKRQAAKEQKKAAKQKSSQDQLEITHSQPNQAEANLPLFPRQESGAARIFLDQFSQGTFNPLRTTSDRLVNLKTTHDTIDLAQPANYGSQQHWETIDGNLTTGRVELNDLSGITDFDSLKSEFESSLSNHHATIDALGENPSQSDLEQYIDDNYLAIAQVLGNHLDAYYEGFVQVNGNVNAFDSLNERGGVCSDIHAAITAFHSTYGKESYVMMSSGNDFAHVISLFKDEGKWYIHNYDQIVETDAQTLEELYDMVMPENRSIKLWSVDEEGNLHQESTDHLTATGREERRFRAEAGVGAFNPWIAEEGVSVGTESISIYQDGVYAEINHAEISAALGYYHQDFNGPQRNIKGVAFEGQYDTNAHGYQRRSL